MWSQSSPKSWSSLPRAGGRPSSARRWSRGIWCSTAKPWSRGRGGLVDLGRAGAAPFARLASPVPTQRSGEIDAAAPRGPRRFPFPGRARRRRRRDRQFRRRASRPSHRDRRRGAPRENARRPGARADVRAASAAVPRPGQPPVPARRRAHPAAAAPGERRGHGLGYPTANLRLDPECGLKHGIYAVRARVHGEVRDGVASFGRRPTFDDGPPLLEVHLFDFSGELYGATIDVAFLGWIRAEAKVAKIQDLIALMAEESPYPCKGGKSARAARLRFIPLLVFFLSAPAC